MKLPALSRLVSLAAAAAVVLLACSPALALPRAGSVLFFPLFDSAPGSGTVISVTNTFTGRRSCSDNRLEGDVRLHYIYFDGESCLEFDRFEFLTPGDTLTVLADDHNPEGERGYLVVIALSPTGGLVNFNHLVGQAIVVQSGLDISWAYNAFTVEALGGDPSNPCDRVNPDSEGAGGDGDFRPDFDGIEYEMLTNEVAIPSFFQEDDRFDNQIALMSTAGNFEIETSFLFYNNIENVFSRTFRFDCWFAGPLSEVSAIVRDLEGDPDETGHGTQTGWASIRGRRARDGSGNTVIDPETGKAIRPAIIAVFVQRIRDTDFAAGDILFGRGEPIDGLEIRR